MSLIKEGTSCARCKSYLFDEDDVVYCPICGAPHHRDCYNALGHCALEEMHGTEFEYTPPHESEEKETAPNDVFSDNPPNPADNADFLRSNGFTVFDLLGGVPADYKLDENVTANDAKKFVLANTHRYIPKFATLSKENKASWNWAAFLFPAPWMISRKMYKGGIIFAFLTIIATLFSIPLNVTVNNLGITAGTYLEVAEALAENISSLSTAVLIFSLVSIVLNIILRVICAVFADFWYKKYTVNSIKRIKKNSDDLDHNYRKYGGVNIFLFFIVSIILEYIPLVMMTLI